MPLLTFFKNLVNDRNADAKEPGDNDCSSCAIPFSLLVRKHTCALCKKPYCSKCTRTVLLVSSRLGEPTPARVCDVCYHERKKQLPEDFGFDKANGVDSGLKSSAYQQLVDYSAVPNGDDSAQHSSRSSRIASAGPSPQSRQESLKQGAVKRSASVASTVTIGRRDKEQKDGSVCWEVPPELEILAVNDESSKVESCNILSDVVSTYEHALSTVANGHLAAIACQLLEAGGVPEPERWTRIVAKLACDAAGLVSPSAMAANGNTDPRFYIKVKRVPGGLAPEDSFLVDGLVIRKNVVHRNMRTNIVQPRIILLQGELELSSNQVSSLDKVMEQAPARLQQAVARIAEFAPDVLILEKTVPHSAKEFLLAQDIAVVQSVKPRTLERLSRCTGTPIVQSVQAINNQSVGHCKEFVIERIPTIASEGSASNLAGLANPEAPTGDSVNAKRPAADPPAEGFPTKKTQGAKTLMYFKGCKKPLGCTILLKGAPQDELTRVKRVTRFLAYAAHRTRLETSFLADCIVSATASLSASESSADNLPAAEAKVEVATSKPAATRPQGDNISQVLDSVTTTLASLEQQERPAGTVMQNSGETGKTQVGNLYQDRFSSEVWLADQSTSVASASATSTSATRHGNVILSVSPHVSVSSAEVPPGATKQDEHSPPNVNETAPASALQTYKGTNLSSSPQSSSVLLPQVETEAPSSSDAAHLLSPKQYTQPQTAVTSFTSSTPSVSRPSTPLSSTPRPSTPVLPVQSAQFDHPLQPPRSPDDPLSLAAKELELEAQQSPRTSFDTSAEALSTVDDAADKPVQGLELYDSQFIFVSTTCKSDVANIWCEEPSLQSIDFCSVKDLSLAAFLASAIPSPPKKCGVPGCGGGPHHHRRTFLHDQGRITLVVHQLAEGHELPGAERGQVWMWLRPVRAGCNTDSVRRVPLTPDVGCMSFGHFLELCFGAKNFVVLDTQLQTGFVRYFAMGSTLACFHYEHILPNDVYLPSVVIHFDPRCEHDWLVEEVEELGKAARDIYGTLEYALQQQAANLHTQDPADVQSWYNCHSLAVVVCQELDAYLDALRLVNTALQQLDDITCIEGLPKASPGQRVATPAELNAMCNIVLEINRLRRQLAISSLTWVATVHDPVVYCRTQTLSSTLGRETAAAAAVPQVTKINGFDPSTAVPAALPDRLPQEPSPHPPTNADAMLLRKASMDSETQSLSGGDAKDSAIAGELEQLVNGAYVAVSVPTQPSPETFENMAAAAKQQGLNASTSTHHRISSMSSQGSASSGAGNAKKPPRPPTYDLPAEGISSSLDTTKSAGKSAESQVGRQHMLAWLVNSQFDSATPSSCSPGMESPIPLTTMCSNLAKNPSYLSLTSVVSNPTSPEAVAVKLVANADETVSCSLHVLGGHHRISSTDSAGFTEIMNRQHTGPVTAHSQLTEALKDASDRGLVSPRFGEGMMDTRSLNAEEKEMPEILGILSPRWGENLLAEGRKLSGPLLHPQFGSGSYLLRPSLTKREDALEPVPEGSRTVDVPVPAVQASDLAELNNSGRKLDDPGRSSSISSSVYMGHFDDWAKFVNHNVQTPNGETPSMPSEVAPPAAADSATVVNEMNMRAIMDQQWADLEHIGKVKLQSGRKGELIPGVIPLLGGQSSKAGEKTSELVLNGRSLLPLGMDDKSFTVFDDEPTSAVAYALNTRHYQTFVHDAMATALYGSTGAGPAMSKEWSETHDKGGRPELGPFRLASTCTDGDHGAIASRTDINAVDFGEHAAKYWKTLLSCEQFHFRHQFEDTSPGMPWGRAKFQVIAYYAPQFQSLRTLFSSGSDKMFTASICRCRKWDSKGGKSNAYFAKSRDNRWIVKQLSKSEKQSFLEFAPNYFRFLAGAVKKNRDTCLAKIVGVFQVSVKPSGPSTATNVGSLYGKDGVIDFLVMENVFYGHRIHKIYDLKGSERSRYNPEDQSDPTCVLLDENLKEANLSAPILMQQDAWVRLERALYNDTSFLANLDVMDYSLLVGLDKENHRLVVGIIDFIRQYTWDKQLETWVKSSGILGGAGKEPTVISPIQYAKRFRTAMSSYFTLVPSWRPPPASTSKEETQQ